MSGVREHGVAQEPGQAVAAGGLAPGRRLARAAAVVVLAAATAATWWLVLGDGLLRAAPIVAVAALLVARVLPVRVALVALVAWVLAAPLLAGLPLEVLRPRALGGTASSLAEGVDALTVPARGLIVRDPWPLAGALAVGGVCGVLGAVMATRPSGAWRAVGLATAVLPLACALALEQAGDVAWPGAAVLAACLLWAARGRLRTTVPATLVVALVAAAGAQAFGPDDRWMPFADVAGRKPAFSRLDTTQTYGPLEDRRTGRAMLEVTADEPALWRMQVLEAFDGGRWRVSPYLKRDLPQPAATETTATVRVRGLTNRLVVSPGTTTGVRWRGGVERTWGDARRLRPGPKSGDTYEVEAEVVQATALGLEDVQIPQTEAEREEYEEYTRVWPTRRFRQHAGRIDAPPPGFADTNWGRTMTLARRLSAGTTSQLEVVRRVQSYLVDSGRYRYTTDVPPAGAQPLYEFLVETREGYCQQFAGGAALLLRMAGIPTRVVTGFATGVPDGEGRYEVRDSDAHAWIEVYFPSFGWVPFNPTPPDAEAVVDPTIDLLTPVEAGTGAGAGEPAAIALGVVAVVGLAGALMLSRRRRRSGGAPVAVGDVLAGLVPGTVAPRTTLAALRPRLAEIGPRVAALADDVQRARFADVEPAPAGERRPHARVWRALRHDVGWARATLLTLRGWRRGA
jgi:hypothetical protein